MLKNPQDARDGPIAVERVVLMPVDHWSPDFIQPSPFCVQGQEGDCLLLPTSRFPTPDTAVIALPARVIDQKPARQMPAGIANPDLPLSYIMRYAPDHATSQVDSPEEYVFMVQYYQPNHPLLYLKVNVTNGPAEDAPSRGDQGTGDVVVPDFPVYEAVLPLPTCADRQGCRSAVLREKGDKEPGRFGITEEFDIKFMKDDNDGAWIEYVMAVPSSEFVPELLVPDDSVDRAQEFEQRCGQDHFYIEDTMDEGFCRSAVTSISADFNERALECDCDAEGSVDEFNCNSLGGQCECKDHVIGRTCTR